MNNSQIRRRFPRGFLFWDNGLYHLLLDKVERGTWERCTAGQSLQVVGAFLHHPKKDPLNGNVREFGDDPPTCFTHQQSQCEFSGPTVCMTNTQDGVLLASQEPSPPQRRFPEWPLPSSQPGQQTDLVMNRPIWALAEAALFPFFHNNFIRVDQVCDGIGELIYCLCAPYVGHVLTSQVARFDLMNMDQN